MTDELCEKTETTAREVNNFLKMFCCAFLGVGAQTSRVCRNAERIATSFGFHLDMAIFPHHLMLTVTAPDGFHWRTSVGSIASGAPNFLKQAKLNSLGWRIVDEHLTIEESHAALAAILTIPNYNPWLVTFMISCANAAFCHLFGGDAVAMGVVLCATLTGFCLRRLLHSWKIDDKIIFFFCALIASVVAMPCVLMNWGATPQTALASSVLFLIPGVPLINAILDILDGHVLMGFTRSVQSAIMISCIAFGLALTMVLLGGETL